MAEMSIFEDEAFSVDSLLVVINEEHEVPGQIAASGLFTEEGSTTVTQQVEKDGDVLELVAAVPRGAPGQVVIGPKRQQIPFNCVHLPETFSILADEIQGIRATGSRTELQGVQDVVNARLRKTRLQLDITHEYQRIGSIKGKILNKDGAVLVDLFQTFGIKQQRLPMEFGSVDVSVRAAVALDMQEDALGNVTSTGAIAWCGKNFWSKLISDASVKEPYLAWEAASALRGDRRMAFEFGGVLWTRYRGKLNGVPFVGDDEAYLTAVGVPDLYKTVFAPANYMETVNTLGVPYYSKLERMQFDKGVAGEAQSNPLHLCTRPRVNILLQG
ncbi:major capsid protein [Pseudomonas indica]|uniref:Phage major capsid protein E n=1 Tax=Pseudomonas indica TaxID=137658 RepID=A0A1G8V4L1_9PSED|nr:major capsid protein [Pseudomonas indica]SDJ61076.1 Phage major capsid protein E [Pseudomonas indica]